MGLGHDLGLKRGFRKEGAPLPSCSPLVFFSVPYSPPPPVGGGAALMPSAVAFFHSFSLPIQHLILSAAPLILSILITPTLEPGSYFTTFIFTLPHNKSSLEW